MHTNRFPYQCCACNARQPLTEDPGGLQTIVQWVTLLDVVCQIPRIETGSLLFILFRGGVTLRFTGQYLNVATQPRMVVFIASKSYYSDVSMLAKVAQIAKTGINTIMVIQ